MFPGTLPFGNKYFEREVTRVQVWLKGLGYYGNEYAGNKTEIGRKTDGFPGNNTEANGEAECQADGHARDGKRARSGRNLARGQ
jgi:hypothetical protein